MNRKKLIVLTVLVVLLLTCSVSGTLAWLSTKTDPVENVFTPVELDTEISEDFAKNEKTRIAVTNVQADDHIPAYVRVGVSGNWVDKDGKIVTPWDGEFEINTTDWFKGSDGYYYYKKVLPVGATTEDLLATDETIILTEDANGNTLAVTVIHQSIQTVPSSVVATEWPVVTVNSDGTLSAKSN